jgi:hypothetical protein
MSSAQNTSPHGSHLTAFVISTVHSAQKYGILARGLSSRLFFSNIDASRLAVLGLDFRSFTNSVSGARLRRTQETESVKTWVPSPAFRPAPHFFNSGLI